MLKNFQAVHIFVNAEIRAEYQVLKALKNWGIKEAHIILGDHDIIADVKTDNEENSNKFYQSEL